MGVNDSNSFLFFVFISIFTIYYFNDVLHRIEFEETLIELFVNQREDSCRCLQLGTIFCDESVVDEEKIA